MNLPVHQRYFADTETTHGEGHSAKKYVLFRQLSLGIPSYVEAMMSRYGENYILNLRPELYRDDVLEIKEKIDDYLSDVQHRTTDRLDDSSLSRLKVYSAMKFEDMIDKLNSIKIVDKVKQFIDSYETES